MEFVLYIREAKLEDAEAIAQVHFDCWQTTYQGLLPREYIEKRTYEKRLNNWQQRLNINNKEKPDYFTYIAEVAGKIIGFIDGGSIRGDSTIYTGEIYALYILEAYQRRGIGKSLVRVMASKLLGLSFTSAMVWVLEGNPAVNFYQSLSGQVVERKTIKIGDDEFSEIAYGWRDIQILISD